MHPVENLIRVAYKTFSNNLKQSGPNYKEGHLINISQHSLQNLLDALGSCTAANMYLLESMNSLRKPFRSPVTHIDICENKFFTIGIFILHPGSRLPLHDHPDMFGALKVIHGEIKVKNYMPITSTIKGLKAIEEIPVILSSSSLPEVLTPEINNLHEIEYVRGEPGDDFAAFVDILSPPYYSINQTHPVCRYYKVCREESSNVVRSSGSRPCVELLFCSCPSEYYSDTAPYKGPGLKKILQGQETKLNQN